MKEQKNRMVNSGDFRQDPNYVAPDKEKEKLILQLGTMITDRYLVKYSRTMKTDDPEYWALDEVLTKEEAKFLLSFKKTRVPYDIEDLAKMNNMSYEDTKKMVDHLVWVGLIEMNRENADHHKQYNVPIGSPQAVQCADFRPRIRGVHDDERRTDGAAPETGDFLQPDDPDAAGECDSHDPSGRRRSRYARHPRRESYREREYVRQRGAHFPLAQ